MNQDIQDIIHLIEKSALDQTIKEILIRDLQTEGLTDFLREQIKAYCLEGIKAMDEQMASAKAALENSSQPQNPV
jgi:pimeloyl-CoA synthetase